MAQEAVQIANTPPTQLLNSRTEYIRPLIQRLAHADLIPDIAETEDKGLSK